MSQVSTNGMWLRGALYFLVPFLGVLAADREFSAAGTLTPGLVCTALGAGLVAVRAFIDTSSDKTEPVQVETVPGAPLETIETKAEKEMV